MDMAECFSDICSPGYDYIIESAIECKLSKK
jgi:hypothetical protein